MCTDIKETLIKSKLEMIKDINAKISESYEEIKYYTDEIKTYREDIEKLEKEIENIKNDSSFTGKPSIQYRKGFAGLSDNQTDTVNSWIIQHEQKYHTEYFYGLTSKKSPNYEISWESTHLGDFAECTCKLCESEHKIDNKQYSVFLDEA